MWSGGVDGTLWSYQYVSMANFTPKNAYLIYLLSFL